MGSNDFLNALGGNALGGAAGSSLYDQLGRQQAYNNALRGIDPLIAWREEMERSLAMQQEASMKRNLDKAAKDYEARKPKTFREELQAETDEWLRDD